MLQIETNSNAFQVTKRVNIISVNGSVDGSSWVPAMPASTEAERPVVVVQNQTTTLKVDVAVVKKTLRQMGGRLTGMSVHS